MAAPFTEDDLIPLLLKAQQTATQAQRRGALLVQPPTQLPTLDLRWLNSLPAEQAAMVVRERRLQQERNVASDQNSQALLNAAIEHRLTQKERDNQASEYAAQIGSVLPKYKEAEANRDQALARLKQLRDTAFQQQDAGSIKLLPSGEKPKPTDSVFFVTPWKFNPATVKDQPASWYQWNAKKENAKDSEDRNFANQKVASSLTEAFVNSVDEANKAIVKWKEAEKELQDTDKSLRKPGFLFRDGAVHDQFTKKSYPLDTKMKNFEYNPKTFQLVPR